MPREKRGVGGEDEAMRKRRSATLRSASNLKKPLNCPQPTAYVSCWAGESPREKVSSNPDFSTVCNVICQPEEGHFGREIRQVTEFLVLLLGSDREDGRCWQRPERSL